MRPERWLQAAGIGTWIASTVPALIGVAGGGLYGGRFAIWSLAALVFLAAFGGFCWETHAAPRRYRTAVMLGVQAAASLAMVASGREGMAAALLVVVAGQLPWILSATRALLWVAVQTVALIIVFGTFAAPLSSATYGFAFGGFQVFALGTAALARRERDAREQLSAANTELMATRALMAEHSRVAERLRISRELHDALGHHLTALSLQLDIASRLSEGKGAEHVQQAHAITRLLLADVREVVGELRESSRFDLGQALQTLAAAGSDRLVIHFEAPDTIAIDDDAQAHTLLRSVQEIATNATRHSGASNLWVTIQSNADGVVLQARDDGRGAAVVTWGHGLTGMRERFEALAGQIEVRTSLGCGFEVRGFLPRVQVTS